MALDKIYWVICFLFMSGCSYIERYYPHDNPVEEAVEEYLEIHTGIKADITGDSAE